MQVHNEWKAKFALRNIKFLILISHCLAHTWPVIVQKKLINEISRMFSAICLLY